jgi:hypothetical protein
MDSTLRGLTSEAFLVYLNDVILIGSKIQEQLDNLQKLFQRPLEAHLKMNAEKCQLYRKEVRYLDHIVSLSGVTTDPRCCKYMAKNE